MGNFRYFIFPEYGSAWMMGVTGTIHILASHTSVGAALLFAFLAYKAYKEKETDLYPYMKKVRYVPSDLFLCYRFPLLVPVSGITATASQSKGYKAP